MSGSSRRRLLAYGGAGVAAALLGGGVAWWRLAPGTASDRAVNILVLGSDQRDAADLYRVLEEEVIPLYYTRDVDGLPRAWIKRMQRSVGTLAWRFSAHRMVMDYVKSAYLPAAGGVSCEMPQR